MLLDLREKVRSSKPLKYSLITIICIPFALVGVGSYLSGGGAPPVAEVNGVEISQGALEAAYSQQRQQLARMFGGQIPEALANDAALREQAREQLIDQQVIQSAVENAKFAVGDETLGRAIQQIPAFQIDGQFDQDTYVRTLRSAGQSPGSFEQNLRSQTAVNQFREGVVSTGFSLPGEAARLDALRRQVRTVDLITLELGDIAAGIEVSDDDVQAHFDENADGFQFPERAKVQYIELNSSEFADSVEISDDEAQEYYDRNKSRYVVPEQRSASHILLEADGSSEIAAKTEEAAELKSRLDAGETFADLAKEFSNDPGSADNGGSLGPILPGAMVAPFETAVNELAAVGDVSDPVVTEFGVHLVKLDAITPEKGKLFEEVKEEIVELMKQDQADKEFNDIRVAMEEAVFDSSDSLDEASEGTGLEIQETDWVDIESDNGELFSNPAVIQAVFSDDVYDEGLNSDVIQLSNRHIVALRVLESEGPRQKTIDDVRDEITTRIQNDRAAEQLDTLASVMQDKLNAGEAVQDIADAEDLAVASLDQNVERQGSTLDASLVGRIFTSVKPSEGAAVVDTVTAGNGDRIVFALRSVSVPEADADAPVPTVANLQAGNTAFNYFSNLY